MKVTVATPYSDLGILTNLDESIIVYTNNKKIYHEISKLRASIDHTTIVIYDIDKKTPEQVILEHHNRLSELGIDSLEAFDLAEVNDYTVPIFIGIVLFFIFLVILYYMGLFTTSSIPISDSIPFY